MFRFLVKTHLFLGFVSVLFVLWVFLYPRISETHFDEQCGLGGITHNSLKIWFRVSPAAECKTCGGVVAPIVYAEYWPVGAEEEKKQSERQRGILVNSYFSVTTLEGLLPDTEYEVMFYIGRRRFVALMMKTKVKTLASPGKGHEDFSFFFGSCFLPRAYPMDDSVHLLDRDALPYNRSPRVKFGLFLGDAVYVDSIFQIPYERAYFAIFAQKQFKWFPYHTPAFYQVDDHEMWNNCDTPNSAEAVEALRWYDRFLGSRNPHNYGEQKRYYSFYNGQSAFFVLDARSHRNRTKSEDGPSKTMLGKEQLGKLLEWVAETDGDSSTVRFVASPVPWTDAVTDGDGWRHYLHERNVVLDALEKSGKKTVLLSGDLHYAIAAQVRPTLVEFSVSPISSSIKGEKPWKKAPKTSEKILFKSEWKNHVARADVHGDNVTVEIWSELPLIGVKKVFSTTL